MFLPGPQVFFFFINTIKLNLYTKNNFKFGKDCNGFLSIKYFMLIKAAFI